MKRFFSFLLMAMFVVSASAITKVKVTGNGVRLRTSPNTYENNIFTSVNKGTVLDYYDTYGDFYKVGYKGRVLFVSRDYSSLFQAADPAPASSYSDVSSSSSSNHRYSQVVVGNHNKIRMRTCPSTNCDYLIWSATGQTVYAYKGDCFDYLGEQTNGFYHILYRGVECWIASEFCYLR